MTYQQAVQALLHDPNAKTLAAFDAAPEPKAEEYPQTPHQCTQLIDARRRAGCACKPGAWCHTCDGIDDLRLDLFGSGDEPPIGEDYG